jgi:DNA-binding response OmpR family regulator
MAHKIDLLVAVKQPDGERFRTNLSAYENFRVRVAHTIPDALAMIDDREYHVDVLVCDNNLEADVFSVIGDLRQRYPRLLIVLVDEEADFAMPGQADDISTEPFRNDDLIRRISRLISDRRQETLRSDSLPAVRQFAKLLRTATGAIGKQQVAVQACKEMNYDYVAYYHRESNDPLRLALKAHAGSKALEAIAPREATIEDLMGWVQQNGQSRIAAPEDRPNHPLVTRGRLGAVACVPVMFNNVTSGVMTACRERPGTITQENVLMLELICSQLGASLSRETGGLS